MLALLNKSKRAKSVESGMLIVTLILTECLILWQAIYVTTGLSQLGQESHSQGKKLKTAVHAVPNMMTVTEIEHDVCVYSIILSFLIRVTMFIAYDVAYYCRKSLRSHYTLHVTTRRDDEPYAAYIATHDEETFTVSSQRRSCARR